ncbi:unnamed protein product, partial [Laminaria digitata]
TILILRSGITASRRRGCKGGAYRIITLRDAALLRVSGVFIDPRSRAAGAIGACGPGLPPAR